MYCRKCGTKNDDQALKCVNCGEVLQQAPVVKQIPNYFVWAVLVTIFCFLPTGIAAIYYAAQVNPKLQVGDYAGAEEASKKAKKWCWVSFIVFISWMVLWFLVAIIGILSPTSKSKTNQNLSSQTAEQTANWRSYYNENFKYQIKYPSNWFYAETKFYDSESDKIGYNTPFFSDIKTRANVLEAVIGITKIPAESSEKEVALFFKSRKDDYKDYSEKTVEIAGQDCLQITYISTARGADGKKEGGRVFRTFIKLSSGDYLDVTYMDQGTDYTGIYNKMLSTFKFTK